MLLYCLIAACQNCWALIMSLFSKIHLLPSSRTLTYPSTDRSCQAPAVSLCEEFPGPGYFLSLMITIKLRAFTLWDQGHKSLQSSTPIREREERSILPPHVPFFLMAGRQNFLSPSKLAITNPAISMPLSASCLERNVIFSRRNLWQQICHTPRCSDRRGHSRTVEEKTMPCTNCLPEKLYL